jgi:UDP-N-acetylglucosamine 2-epimerase (non-hydrolysing)
MKIKALFVFGTRPEAIKMAPVIKEMQRRRNEFEVSILVTAQHRELLDQALEVFDLKPDFDLDIMKANQGLEHITTSVIQGVSKVLQENKYDLILVHGDTTTSFSAALAAFYCKVDVAHVEAGLRTFNKNSPWPEEMNRSLTARLADYHFAPTKQAQNNLYSEGISKDHIFVTGNTVIDALLLTSKRLDESKELQKEVIDYLVDYKLPLKIIHNWIGGERKMVLITGHRRENFGQGFLDICEAIKELALKNKDVDFVYPVHFNPNVRSAVKSVFDTEQENLFFIEPINYLPFVFLLKQCYLILTDSGGIQEEAPSLNKPVVVLRDTTERPEAIDSGTAILVGTNKELIFSVTNDLLNNENTYNKMSEVNNPYGKGDASKLICDFLAQNYFK